MPLDLLLTREEAVHITKAIDQSTVVADGRWPRRMEAVEEKGPLVHVHLFFDDDDKPMGLQGLMQMTAQLHKAVYGDGW